MTKNILTLFAFVLAMMMPAISNAEPTTKETEKSAVDDDTLAQMKAFMAAQEAEKAATAKPKDNKKARKERREKRREEDRKLRPFFDGGAHTGFQVSTFKGGKAWAFSPRIGGHIAMPEFWIYIVPAFTVGSLTHKPGNATKMRGRHFAVEAPIGTYLYNGAFWSLGVHFGPGYMKTSIDLLDGELVNRERSGVTCNAGIMARIEGFHLFLNTQTSSLNKKGDFLGIPAVSLGIGYGWML